MTNIVITFCNKYYFNMFYDKNLMNGEILGIVWKLANNIHTDNIGNHNISRICTELGTWINVAVVPNRLSLRTSSTLVNGTAILYQRNMHQLLDDVIKLDEDIVQRRRRKHFSSSSTSDTVTDSYGSTATPEEMRRQPTADFDFDSSFSPTKRAKLDHKALYKSTPNVTMSRSSSDNLTSEGTTNNCNEQNSKDKCNENDNCGSENGDVVVDLIGNNVTDNIESENIHNQRIDKEVQTSPIVKPNRSKSINDEDQGFDPNLPFGCILIHDSYQSRIPSKIVFTSLNSSVRNLK